MRNIMRHFERVMNLTSNEFLDNVHFHARLGLLVQSIVMECLVVRMDIDPSEEIMDDSCKHHFHQQSSPNCTQGPHV